VLGSLQGQLLLQSCTSLLLTYSTLPSADYTIAPWSLRLCVLLLERLQPSEALAAAGGSSYGISQSLAAGLFLIGRCFKLLSLQISPPGTDNSGSACSTEQQGTQLRAYLREWLYSHVSSTATGEVLQAADQIDSELTEDLRVQADRLQRAVQRTDVYLEHIRLTLQQERARIFIPPPSEHITSSTRSIQEGRQHGAAVSACDAGQHCGGKQHQQPTADWLLAVLHAADAALQKVLFPLSEALTPYLVGMDPLSTPVNPHALLLPQLLAAAGEAVCAAVPSSACCSNPCCSNLSGVSASFALVRGKGCVCGGCLGLQTGEPAPRQGALIAAR
jgi:hypothetical protein